MTTTIKLNDCLTSLQELEENSIDTTPTTKNLLKLFGSANRVITNYIQEIEKTAPKRFAYIPKASKSERNRGCEGLEKVGGEANELTVRGNTNPICLLCNKSKYDRGNGVCECEQPNWKECINKPQSNFHPTVKPIALMEYLVKLVSREGATVLDPFMGSGSTGVACVNLKRNFIGIEREADYIKIAEARINKA